MSDFIYDILNGPNIKITIQQLEKLNKYLLIAIVESIGQHAREETGTMYCGIKDVNNPECAGLFSKQNIERYFKYANVNMLYDVITMCELYLYFDDIIFDYSRSRKPYVSIPFFERSHLRRNVLKAIQFINDRDSIINIKTMAEFKQLADIIHPPPSSKNKNKNDTISTRDAALFGKLIKNTKRVRKSYKKETEKKKRKSPTSR